MSVTSVDFISRTRKGPSGSDPNEDYFYLAGPMTGIPQFNFRAFDDAAEVLRANGYNLLSPAELDDDETRAAALASKDGAPGSGTLRGETHADFLGRDVKIVADEKCIGVICLPGWQDSKGAKLETDVARQLNKPVLEYAVEGGAPQLTEVTFKADDKPPVKRQTLAEDALELVNGARQADYGHPIEDFRRSADMFTAILSKQLRPGQRVREDQIPLLMIAVKLSRLVQSPYHEDSLRDLHGYGLTAEMVWGKLREEDDIADAQKAVREAG